MANKVTTEWFDIHVKHGNYLPNEKQTTLYEQQKALQDKLAEECKLENVLDAKNQEQLQEIEDDLDFDDDFMREYMAKRTQEIKEKAEKMKYGKVLEISRDEYIREVTDANPDDLVVLHLYQTANEFCHLINMHLPTYAEKYGHVKFIKIIANKCIDNFPDSSCPCILIYKAGKPVSNITHVDKHLKDDINNFDSFLQSQGITEL